MRKVFYTNSNSWLKESEKVRENRVKESERVRENRVKESERVRENRVKESEKVRENRVKEWGWKRAITQWRSLIVFSHENWFFTSPSLSTDWEERKKRNRGWGKCFISWFSPSFFNLSSSYYPLSKSLKLFSTFFFSSSFSCIHLQEEKKKKKRKEKMTLLKSARVNNVPDERFMIRFDADGNVCWWNQKVEKCILLMHS